MGPLFIFLLFLPVLGHTSPAEEREEKDVPILESAQELFGHRINTVANRLDAFFATERADDELGRSKIRIRSTYSMRERAVGDLNNRYTFNLRLPHLEEKFRWQYYQDSAKMEAEKKEKAIRKEHEQKKKDQVKTGWLFNADAGVTAAIPPRLTTRARLRNSFQTGTLVNRFTEQMTYVTDESGLVHETSLDSDETMTEFLLFRFRHLARWQILQKDFTTNHGPAFIHQISDYDAMNYSLTLASSVVKGIWFVTNYTFTVNYRRNLYRNWLYLDIVPGIDFPKEWSFRRTPFLNLQLELLFGD